jgi:hypothetical protein
VAAFDRSLGGQGLLRPANIKFLVGVLRELGGSDLSIVRLSEGHVKAVDLLSRYVIDADTLHP